MLSSWFGNKTTEEGDSTRTTPRPSSSSLIDAQDAPRTSTESKSPKRAFPTAYTTPHDAIIVDLQTPAARSMSGDPYPSAYEQTISPEPEFTPAREDKSSSRTDPNFLSSVLGQQYSALQQQNPRSQLLLDPFDGNVLGVLAPYQEQGATNEDTSPSQVNIPINPDINVSTRNTDARSEAVWSHLSRILELQGQLSKMHLEMENIGTGKAADPRKKHKRRDDSAPESPNPGSDTDIPPVPPQPRKRAMSTGSRGSFSGEADGDEEGVDMPSEEAEKDRIREEEFAKLATQFEGRKEAINDIMGKLDDLSSLLFEFHDLKSPNIEFPASRNNSVAVSSPPRSTSPLRSSTAEPKGYTTPLPRSTATTSNRTHEWAQQNVASSSKLLPVPLVRERSENNTPPRGSTPKKKVPPTLLINSIDSETQAAVMDSPISTIGSMKLPREE